MSDRLHRGHVLMMTNAGSAVVAAFSLGVFCGSLVLYGAAPALWVAAIGLVGCGFGYGSAFTTFAGVAQIAATDEMRGRALAANTFILGSLYPIGALIQGWLADRLGLKWVTAASGELLLLAVAWRMSVIQRSWRASGEPRWPRLAIRRAARR